MGRRSHSCRSRDGKAPQLYVAPLDGGEARKLTDLPEGAASPAWSPDSSRIAFLSTVRGPDWDEDDENKRPPRVITKVGLQGGRQGLRPGPVLARLRRRRGRFRGTAAADRRRLRPQRSGLVAGRHHDRALREPRRRPDDPPRRVAADGRTAASCAALTASDAMYIKPSWSPDGDDDRRAHVPAPRERAVELADRPDRCRRRATCATSPSHLDRQCGPYFAPREPIWIGGRLLFPVDAAGNTHLFAMDVAGRASPSRCSKAISSCPTTMRSATCSST